jgi:outer membrane lipoprotein SlyB
MVHIRRFFLAVMMITLAGLGMTAEAQRRPYRVTDQQVQQLISSIATRTDVFRSTIDSSLDRSRIDGTRTEDDINSFIRDFQNATDQLRDRFNRRQSVAADVQEVLDRAAFINSFMQRNRLGVRAERDWASLRTDLNDLARVYGINWNWANQTNSTNSTYPTGTAGVAYNVSEQELRSLLVRIDNRASRFSNSLSLALNNSRYDGRNREDNINEFVRTFTDATNNLRVRFNSRQSTTADVQNVLDRAARIDTFMQRNQLDARAENDWSALRADLTTLAGYYNVAWNWNGQGGIPNNQGGGVYSSNGLTGTFRLDTTRSDDARVAAERATRTLPYRDRQRVLDSLTARLESPDQLAIERRGQSVTIASSRSPQISFDADGRVANEQTSNGRMARVSATLNGDQLVVSSTGVRDTDFSVTFEPIDGGRRLRVTRRISDINLSSPVVVQSTYDKISEVARFDIYTGTQNYPDTGSTTSTTSTSGDFVVPNGTQLIATLNTNLSTRDTRDNDRFTMTVTSPTEFDGAVIDGYVSNVSRSGRISGRSGITFNFDTIRLRDGRSYRFAGILDTVRTASGETVRVDNEGTVQEGDSRTNTTAKRAAIGTAVGAIIGAIAGGGKGAAIGAIVGAGAGAGSVYVQGQDDLNLTSGTEVTIHSTGPNAR